MRTAIQQSTAWVLLGVGACAAGIAHGMDSNFEKRMAADPNGVVEVSNVSGTVDVVAWDNPEVEIRAEVGAGVDRIDTTSEHGRISIKVIVPNHSFRSASADLRIHVPRGSDLDISAVSADVTASDVEGSQQLKTVSGNVKSDVFQKNTEIKTVSGDVALRGRGKEAGAAGIHVSTVSGNIRIDRAGGDVELTTVSGDMTVRLDHPAHSVRVRSTSGDVGFEGKLAPGAYLDAQSVSGDLTIRAKPEGSLDYEVNTFSGDISNCMGKESERVSKYGPGRRLNGTLGAAGNSEAKVRVKTMSGDVELCDKS
jgi:DUF4097 and DUF4098 domain-containing protein YvlB